MWDWDGSEREYKLAIALSPEYATAHQWYAISLAARFYFSQAQLEMQRALELDPLSLPINADLAQILYFQGEFDAAIEQCRHTLALDPNFVNAHVYLHQSYIQKQMYDDAMREYFRVRELQSGNGAIRSNQEPALRAAYEAGGIRGFWQESLKQHDSMPPGIRDPYLKAEFHALLGENEKALDELTVAVSRLSPSMLFVLVNPVFKGLNKDQRFLVLVEQVATVHRKQVENADTSAK
jgi:tetratricopeptide (TPR) repeat protein